MQATLKRLLTKRAILLVLVALLVLSLFNTYFIFESTRTSLSSSPVSYDYALSQVGNSYRLKNMLTGAVSEVSVSDAINSALNTGNSIYLNSGTYVLNDDIIVKNKINAKIVGNDQAIILGNDNRILIVGDDYSTSQNVLISGLTLINATIRVENSFGTTIKNVNFINATTGIEFANTNTWTEYSKVEDCQFINIAEGIAFRTPTGNGTGSYSSSQIERVSFKLTDFSIGIKVEKLAEFSDSQVQNVRFWIGENGRANQTGLLVDGSMYQTQLFGVVFESFTDQPVYLFGIDIGPNCDPAPTLASGVSFLGNWTAKVHDELGIWLSSVGAAFKRENIDVPVGTSNQYGENVSIYMRPLTIFSFKPKIQVDGSFPNNETVTVRIRIEFIDNVISSPVVRSFTSSGGVWLNDDEIMQLFPSQDIIWAILVDAKTTASSSSASVKVSGYGTAG